MNEAFVDFTGGVGEVLYLRQDIAGLFSALRHALAKESLVGATAVVREPASCGDPQAFHVLLSLVAHSLSQTKHEQVERMFICSHNA